MDAIDSPSDLRSGIFHSLVGATVLAAISTFGDWLWTHYIPDGAVVPGVIHGAVIFLILAGVLAWSAGTGRAVRRLVPTFPLVGVVIAAAFYPLAGIFGYVGALLITWVAMWLSTAALQRWAREGRESVARTFLRGALAAIASGLAFWAISGIWTKATPGGPNYLWHFVCWGFAFLPGFLALLVGQPGGRGPRF